MIQANSSSVPNGYLSQIFSENKPPKISSSLKPSERLKAAFEGSDPILMQECFNEFLADPLPFMEKNITEGEMYLKGFTFHHCACGAWGRDTSELRQKAETIIVEDIDKLHQNKGEMIRIGSFGAGGLLEDLIIVGKLIQKGFKNITIFFVDNTQFDKNKADKFAEMLNKLPEINIKTIYAPFFGSKIKFDAIYSIDLNNLNKFNGDCWRDVFNTKNSALTDNGKFYLFGDNIQLILDKNDNLQDLHEGAGAFFEKYFTPSKLPDMSKLEKIKILVAKSKQLLNFNFPRIAKVVQILSQQFNKPIDIQLYGSDTFTAAFRLNGDANCMVLEKLSGKVSSLSIKYHKEESPLQQQAKAAHHIFIKELEKGEVSVTFSS